MNKPLHIVVVNTNASPSSLSKDRGELEFVEVKNLQEVGLAATPQTIDVLVLDKSFKLEDLSQLGQSVDLSNTVVMAGPLPVGESVKAIRGVLENGKIEMSSVGRNVTLEDYVESKFGEFVRAMKASSARSLYSTLIHAVERPMIELALRETHGNQIQAAELLGLNRNTLRKKISECNITVKRRSRSRRESTSN